MPTERTVTRTFEDQASRYSSKLTWGTIAIATLVVTSVYLFWTNNLQTIWLRGIVMTGIIMIPIFAVWRTFWPKATRTKDLGFLLAIGAVAVVMMQSDMQSLWKNYVFSLTPLGLASPVGDIILTPAILILALIILAGWGIWRTKKKGRSTFP